MAINLGDMLAFERHYFRFLGTKEQAIRETFDITPPRYYQQLNALLDDPEALKIDALLVNRLRRRRDEQKASRSARRLTTHVG